VFVKLDSPDVKEASMFFVLNPFGANLMSGHGHDQITFDDLDFHGRARSVNGAIRHLERAIRKHVREARRFGKDPKVVHATTTAQVERLLRRLRGEE